MLPFFFRDFECEAWMSKKRKSKKQKRENNSNEAITFFADALLYRSHTRYCVYYFILVFAGARALFFFSFNWSHLVEHVQNQFVCWRNEKKWKQKHALETRKVHAPGTYAPKRNRDDRSEIQLRFFSFSLFLHNIIANRTIHDSFVWRIKNRWSTPHRRPSV